MTSFPTLVDEYRATPIILVSFAMVSRGFISIGPLLPTIFYEEQHATVKDYCNIVLNYDKTTKWYKKEKHLLLLVLHMIEDSNHY